MRPNYNPENLRASDISAGLRDLIDEAWYLETYPDVELQDSSAALHFLNIGWAEGRNPSPLFDTEWYFRRYPDVETSGINPLRHYCATGWKEHRQPHPLFDSLYYLESNADVRNASVNPLHHYVKYGWKEGRRPHPLFDASWYANQCNGDLDSEPLSHYLRFGAKMLLDPNRLFDSRWYVERYPEAAPNPLAHYAEFGVAKRLSPHPSFDGEFYLEHYPDVLEAGINPLVHFIARGYLEGRKPHPNFDVSIYNTPEGRSADPFSIVLAQNFKCPPAAKNESGPIINPPDHQGHPAGIHDGEQIEHRYTDGAPAASQGAPPGISTSHQTELFSTLFEVTTGARSPMFAPYTDRSASVRPTAPKAIAFYLPQFHPFKENDTWWGKGFTEWTNVSKAVPQFKGHYQPRLPGELGHYDLRLPEVMQRQIELARQYGIYGFCFHYYWFSGHRLLEKPLEMFLSKSDADFDFPFCLCWANENWTRRWDGAEHDVLMQQSHNAEDHLAVFNDLLRYFKDPRYIKINNRPVIVVYRPGIIDELAAMVDIWRKRAREEGFDDLFLIAANSFGFNDYKSIGFDGLCEFPPHNVVAAEHNHSFEKYNPNHEGKIYQYTEARNYSLDRLKRIQSGSDRANYFPTVMLGWDNEARKPGRGNVFAGADPREFYEWFLGILRHSEIAHDPNARMVFVNAWNEWGEGTYLEPDRWFGYAYLNAVTAAYETLDMPTTTKLLPAAPAAPTERKRGIIFLHAFYHDLLPELAGRMSKPWIRDHFDVVATVPTHWSFRQMQDAQEMFRPKTLLVTPNRGRDMFPFVQALQTVDLGAYDVALKLHTKKSPHLQHGARWAQAILDALTGEREVANILADFRNDSRLGLMAPRAQVMAFNDPSTLRDNRKNIELIVRRYGLTIDSDATFVAGSMFWFRPAAFEPFQKSPLSLDDFGPELGAIDGTMAHALERLLPRFVQRADLKETTYNSDADFNPYL